MSMTKRYLDIVEAKYDYQFNYLDGEGLQRVIIPAPNVKEAVKKYNSMKIIHKPRMIKRTIRSEPDTDLLTN